MRRVSRRPCEDGPLLEEQETEGQRQLHSLLLQQLHTDVDIDRCVAKKQCFAPAALYRPFGEQAAGVRSLSQFQALQDGENELASLRELGLTDTEIKLWQSRDTETTEKTHGVCAAPGAREQRLQVIRDKIEARDELLSRPQRFAASRPLSRREIEIERSLFQGNDRLGFLTALYHRDEEKKESQQGESSSNSMDSLYRDVLRKQTPHASLQENQRENDKQQDSRGENNKQQDLCTENDELSGLQRENNQLKEAPELKSLPPIDKNSSIVNSGSEQLTLEKPAQPIHINLSQQIGSLRGGPVTVTSGAPLTVRGKIETITDEEILQNRESEEGIKSISRFRNYEPGKPSKVLCVKNMSAQASVAQLVALFSRFEQESGPPVLYRLLTGRMKGQAFITLPDAETAQKAQQLVHGYRLLGKPLVVEFGRERQEEEKQKEKEKEEEK